MSQNSHLERCTEVAGITAPFGVGVSPSSSTINISDFVTRYRAAEKNICTMDVFWCMHASASWESVDPCPKYINFNLNRVASGRISRVFTEEDKQSFLANVFNRHGTKAQIADICG